MILASIILITFLFLSVDLVKNKIKGKVFDLSMMVFPYVVKQFNKRSKSREAIIKGKTAIIFFIHENKEYEIHVHFDRTNTNNEYYGINQDGDEILLKDHLPGLDIPKIPKGFKSICYYDFVGDRYELD